MKLSFGLVIGIYLVLLTVGIPIVEAYVKYSIWMWKALGPT